MPRILHLVKDPANRVALDVLEQQARDPGNTLVVVLLQEAARFAAPVPGEVYRIGDGAGARYPEIDHSRLLDLIFAADTVVTW